MTAVATLWRHRGLIAHLSIVEWRRRYLGSALGLAWSFLQPLTTLALYWVVFGRIFKARWDSPMADSGAGLALVLFCGLVVFNVFSECVQRAPGLLLANIHYIKRVVFPAEILPVTLLLSVLLHGAGQLLVLWLGTFLVRGASPTGIFWLPFILLPLALLCQGVSWVLSAVGVAVRDSTPFVGMVLPAVFFLTPIVYPASALPAPLAALVALNPLTFFVESARSALLFGEPLRWGAWAASAAVASAAFFAGHAVFMRARREIADAV